MQLAAPTPQGAILLHSLIQPPVRKGATLRQEDSVATELPYDDALVFWRALSTSLDRDDVISDLKKQHVETADARAIEKQLHAQLTATHHAASSSSSQSPPPTSNKRLHLSTVAFSAPYRKSKGILNVLAAKTVETDATGPVHAAQEQLRRVGEQLLKDVSGFTSKLPKPQQPNPSAAAQSPSLPQMHVEFNRVRSFYGLSPSAPLGAAALPVLNWNTPLSNPGATPLGLSKAGFFSASPIQHGGSLDAAHPQASSSDNCMHFSSGITLGRWDRLQSPLLELKRLAPEDALVNGRPTPNVPSAFTLAALAPRQGPFSSVSRLISAPHTSLALLQSERGGHSVLSVFDSLPEIFPLYSFLASDGQLVGPGGALPSTSADAASEPLLSAHLVRSTPVSAAAAAVPAIVEPAKTPAAPQIKSVDWCMPDIDVYVDKGPYAGSSGTVLDVIDKDNITVFLKGISDVANIAISRLLPVKPRLQNRVRVLAGDHKGSDGVLLNTQGVGNSIGVVRLNQAGQTKIVTVPMASLAVLAHSAEAAAPAPAAVEVKSKAPVPVVSDCCAICVFRTKLTVYELSGACVKWMQSISLPETLQADSICTSWVPSANVLYVVGFDVTANSHQLLSFEFSPDQQRLTALSSVSLSIDPETKISDLCALESRLCALNSRGGVLTWNASSKGNFNSAPEVIAALPELPQAYWLSLFHSKTCDTLLALRSDGFGVVLSADMLFTQSSMLGRPRSAEQKEFSVDLFEPALDPEYEEVPVSASFSSAFVGVKQAIGKHEESGQDYTKWILPSSDTNQAGSHYSFDTELHRPPSRGFDAIGIEVEMARPWNGIDAELVSPSYEVAIHGLVPGRGWTTLLEAFDLKGIITGGATASHEKSRTRSGIIALSHFRHVFARRLSVSMRVIPRREISFASSAAAGGSSDPSRRSLSRRFAYVSDFDENGVLYWIGTNNGKEPHRNPSESGRVTLTISHEKMHSESMSMHSIISRKPTNALYWGGTAPIWFCVDLGSDRHLMVDAYTLRHGYQHANSFLQNWCFQGSHDGEDWATLHEGGDPPFFKGFDSRTFKISDGIEHFRYFRVLQKGNYSMGAGKQGGNPFMCLAGFELYGDLRIGSADQVGPVPNYMHSISLRYFSLIAPNTAQYELVLGLRERLLSDLNCHQALFSQLATDRLSSQMRLVMLDALLDLWKWSPKAAVEAFAQAQSHMQSFLLENVIRAGKSVSSRAGRLVLAVATAAPISLRTCLLRNCVQLLPIALDELECVEGLRQLESVISWCWDTCDNPQLSPYVIENCLAAIQQLGTNLYDHRSPYYNILRRHFSLYDLPLENDLFDPHAAAKALAVQVSSSGSNKGAFSVDPTSGIEDEGSLEQAISWASGEFATARRMLTTLLEDVSMRGGEWTNETKSVTKAYNECLRAQLIHSRLKKRLRRRNAARRSSSDDCRLSRWGHIAEMLLQLLNTRSSMVSNFLPIASYSSSASTVLLTDLFTHFVVYGSPDLRKEVCKFTSTYQTCLAAVDLRSAVSFPCSLLKQFFSRQVTEDTRPIKIFPQQEVFDSLQEMIELDKMRFFYADGLFSLLEELTTAQADTSIVAESGMDGDDEWSIDVPLVSWLLLLLSNLMAQSAADRAPLHKGSRCRNCNMAPIKGVRYRCVNCLDYDVCESCEADIEHNAQHVFLKIPTSLPLPPSQFNALPPPREPLLPPLYPIPLGGRSTLGSGVGAIEHAAKSGTAASHGARCSACSQQIRGIRFLCIHCNNFSLCESCESSGNVEHLPLHLFLKIRRPLPPSSPALEHKPLVPVLLHHEFYPAAQYKPIESMPVPEQELVIATSEVTLSSSPLLQVGPSLSTMGRFHKLSKSVTDAAKLKEEEAQKLLEGEVITTTQAAPSDLPVIAVESTDSGEMMTMVVSGSGFGIKGSKSLRASITDVADLSSFRLEMPHSPSQASSGQSAAQHTTEASTADSSTRHDLPAVPAPGSAAPEELFSFEGRHLESIFSVILLASQLRPLSPELLLLAMRVLENLTTQYTPHDIAEDVFKHVNFDTFLRKIGEYPSVFIRSAVLQMLDKLVQASTYNLAERESSHSLRQIRYLLRRKAMKLLREVDPSLTPHASGANFLMELMLVITTDRDMPQEHLASHRMRRNLTDESLSDATNALPAETIGVAVEESAYPLEDITSLLVRYLVDEMPLNSSLNSPYWCMLLRLLLFCDPSHVANVSNFNGVVHQVLVANEELQSVVIDDFERLLRRLMQSAGSAQASHLLTQVLMPEIVACFPEIFLEGNIGVFTTIVDLMKECLAKQKRHRPPLNLAFQVRHLGIGLQTLAESLPDPQNTHAGEIYQSELVIQLMELISHILAATSESSTLVQGLTNLLLMVTDTDDHEDFANILPPVPAGGPSFIAPLTVTLPFPPAFLRWLSYLGIHHPRQMARSATAAGQALFADALEASSSGSATPASDSSAPAATSSPTSLLVQKKSGVSKSELGKAVVKLVLLLGRPQVAAKHFLQLSLDILRDVRPNSMVLADLCQALMRNEELTLYAMVDLQGASFFYDQIRASNLRARSSFLAPAFASMLSHPKTRGVSQLPTPNASAPSAARQNQPLENLGAMSELLSPKGDKQLEKLLKDPGPSVRQQSSSASSTTGATGGSGMVWTYSFKPKQQTSLTASTQLGLARNRSRSMSMSTGQTASGVSSIDHGAKLTLEFSIPDNVILREIRIDCVSNYNSLSRFPRFVTIETGTALSRLLPVGRYTCRTDAHQVNAAARINATFKFPLPDVEVVKFVRLHVHPPKNSPWIALSRIQLLGHSSLLYTMEREDDPVILARLPLSTCLGVVHSAVRYPRVQRSLADLPQTAEFALILVSLLSPKTAPIIQDIVTKFAKFDPELAESLLHQLLRGQTSAHAALAGALCSVKGDALSGNRLRRLRDFVFKELSSAGSVALGYGSHLIPFLYALSSAISALAHHSPSLELATVSDEQLDLLASVAISSLQGSLLHHASLRLLSAMCQTNVEIFGKLLGFFITAAGETVDFAELGSVASDPTKIWSSRESLWVIGTLSSANAACAAYMQKSALLVRIAKCLQAKKSGQLESTEPLLSFLALIAHEVLFKDWLGEHVFPYLFELLWAASNRSLAWVARAEEVLVVSCNQHLPNQARLAQLLLSHLDAQKKQLGDMSDLSLHLLVDFFSLEDHIPLCFHPGLPSSSEDAEIFANATSAIADAEDLLTQASGALGVAQISPSSIGSGDVSIKLDTKFCHQNLDIDEDGLAVTASSLASSGWRTVMAQRPLKSGVNRWEITLERLTPTANIMIGVCERSHRLNAYVGQSTSAKGWSYYGATTGFTYHDGKSDSRYGQKMVQGDVIGALLDMEEGTLSFSRNGEDLGIAFRDLKGRDLYPAVSLYDSSDRVRISQAEAPGLEKTLLADARLLNGSGMPQRFHRSQAVYLFSATTSLRELLRTLVSAAGLELQVRSGKLAVGIKTNSRQEIFWIHDHSTPDIVIRDLLPAVDRTGILELEVVVSREDTRVNNFGKARKQKTRISLPLLQEFASRQGLKTLVELIEARVAVLSTGTRALPAVVISAATDSPTSPKVDVGYITPPSGVSPVPGYIAAAPAAQTKIPLVATPPTPGSVQPVAAQSAQIAPKVDLSAWRDWSEFLRTLLLLDEFSVTFTADREAISCLLYILQHVTRISGPSTASTAPSAPTLSEPQSPLPPWRKSSRGVLPPKTPASKVSSAATLPAAESAQPSSALFIRMSSMHRTQLPDALIETPILGLYECFSSFIDQHRPLTQRIEIRNRLAESSVLVSLLGHLLSLAPDIQLANPQHPLFQSALQKRNSPSLSTKAADQDPTLSNRQYWAKGTGFGSGNDDQGASSKPADTPWNLDHARTLAIANAKLAAVLSCIGSVLCPEPILDDDEADEEEDEAGSDVEDEDEDPTNSLLLGPLALSRPQPALSSSLYELILASSFVGVVSTYLRNDSLLDMGRHLVLYQTLLRVTRRAVAHSPLVAPLSMSAYSCLEKLAAMADVVLKRLPKTMRKSTFKITSERGLARTNSLGPNPVTDSEASGVDDDISGDESSRRRIDGGQEIALAFDLRLTFKMVSDFIERWKSQTSAASTPQSSSTDAPPMPTGTSSDSDAYRAALEDLLFAEFDMTDPDNGEYGHHYRTRIKGDKVVAPKKMKRLVQEVGSLSTGLPLFLESSVFLRVDQDRIDVMQCIITGPEATPYAHGCFLFDIYCPPEYPSVAPVVNLQTTGSGTVRFNPNLYNCGKVCLSLLGTWRGGATEKWNETTSTLLQVFVSIQSLILVDEPYFNEPGYESAIGTPKGEQQSRAYNEVIRLATIRWAMIDMLQRPPPAFVDVIRRHFALKKDRVLRDVNQWLEDAREAHKGSMFTSASATYIENLVKSIEELKKELESLPPYPP